MKKYLVIAVMALVAVFAVSCNKEKKIDIVGHAWQYQGAIDTMGIHIDMDIVMDFNNADSVDIVSSMTSTIYTQSKTNKFAYTWDGEKNLVLNRTPNDTTVTTRYLTYNKETEEFSMPLNQIESEDADEMIALTGVDVLVFKKIR